MLAFDAWHNDGRPFGHEVPPGPRAAAPQFFAYLAQLEQCQLIDARRADVVISTQPPSFAVEHPRHLSIFFHHNRLFYDLAAPAIAAGMVSAAAHEAASEAVRRIDQVALASVAHILAGSETVQARLAHFNQRTTGVGLFHAGPTVAPESITVASGPRRAALCVSRHDFPKRTELFVHAMHIAREVPAVAVGAGGRLGFVRQLDHRLAEHGAPDVLDPTETWLNDAPWIDPATVPPCTSPIEFRSGIDDAELQARFADAFCCVAPALEEDYGLTAIEAMLHGVPVVTCSDSGHLTHFVEHEVTGLIVEPDGAAIAAAVRRLAADSEFAARLGANGRERAAEFTWDRALREFDLGLEAVLS
jgi:glycosyltransferase involved in cell wall biosynthesis